MFLDLIRKRRSIRKYQNKSLEEGKVALLKEACLRSPSSRGLNPWEFVFVSDRALLKKLSASKTHGSAFLKGASLGVAVLANPKCSDVWIEDSSIASIFLCLAAHDMGLGACWIQIRERTCGESKTSGEFVREILGIPDHIQVEAIVAIGYPDEHLPPVPEEELEVQKIFNNRYGEV